MNVPDSDNQSVTSHELDSKPKRKRLGRKRRYVFLLALVLIALLGLWVLLSVKKNPVAHLAKLKRKQTEMMAKKMGLRVPALVQDYFKAVQAGDYNNATNLFERITATEVDTNRAAWWITLITTEGALEQSLLWDPVLLAQYSHDILNSLPKQSILIAGTDEARFACGALYGPRKARAVYVIEFPALLLTDYGYYCQYTLGDKVLTLSQQDRDALLDRYLKEYGSEYETGRASEAKRFGECDALNAKFCGGGNAIVDLSAKAAKLIFDHNKQTHPVFVQLGHSIPWMYRQLIPDGLIMRLSVEPLDRLPMGAAERDRAFWDSYSARLLSAPRFRANIRAQQSFSKLRSDIGGVYLYRHMDEEAEYALKQALRLYSGNLDAAICLAFLYGEQMKYAQARQVIQNLTVSPGGEDVVQEASKGFLDYLAKKEELDKRLSCIAQLKQIGLWLSLYRDEHKMIPDSIGEMRKSKDWEADKLLQCPSAAASSGTSPSYEYDPKGGMNPDAPIMWDKAGNHKEGRAVLFGNGTVRWMTEEEFDRLHQH